MKLSEGKVGSHYVVQEINLDKDVKRRFEVLGMTHGADMEIMGKKKKGAVIFRLRGTRFAIGKKFADGVIVEVKENE